MVHKKRYWASEADLDKGPSYSPSLMSISKESRRLFPSWIRFFLLDLFGTAVLGLPALLIVLLCDAEEFWPFAITPRFNSTLCEAFRWSLLVAGTYFSYMTALTFVALVPFAVRITQFISQQEVLGIRGKDSLRHILMIRHYFALPIAAFVLWLLASTLVGTIDPGTHLVASSQAFEFYVIRGSFALFIFLSLLLVDKLVVQKIAINYHYDYYADRIEENTFGLLAIRKLRSQFPPTYKIGPITRTPLQEGEQDPMLQELEVEDSSDVAMAIFRGLEAKDRDYLLPRDLERVLSQEDAARLFSILDRDENGDLTMREVLDGVQSTYTEYSILSQALVSNDDLMRRLDFLGFGLVLLITLILCLPIFNVSLAGSIATLAATLMSFKFIFEESLEALFNVIVFIFVSHPFDVGDTISIKDKKYKVKDIGWWNSSFYGDGNRLVYMANEKLATIPISNMRRSGNQSEIIEFHIELATGREQLLDLEKKLNEFIRKNTRDYSKQTMVKISQLIDAEKMGLILSLYHRSNFQSNETRNMRCLKFMQYMRQALVDCRIRLA